MTNLTRSRIAHPATGLFQDYEFRNYDRPDGAEIPYFFKAGRTRLTLAVRFSQFSVRNLFLSLSLIRFQVYPTYTGADPGPYTPTGDPYQLYWYLHRENEVISDATILAANQRIPITRPYPLNFHEDDLFQPGDAGYDGTAFLALYWGNVNYVTDFAAEADYNPRFLINRVDQEINP